ncbi:TonB-dependent receptor [Caenimonas aquaedulcis]|uniref:TonB-dependent receptor n=1 Tax=Caenimonas aquaedulcis TaxID=2793270 RepID=A0A931MGC6_9BURK|nr:TonB-dependent receptor [Caenimonas aquaedulcis]MBG9387933.1 TonB-dependent receptor [Caenimonas aquaedulcis]
MKTGTQRFRKTVVARALITAFCGTASMMIAQETLAQSSSSLQRVEVTGSNIRRTDTETASPVQTISREEIQNSGKASVAEFLQTLAADNQGSVPTTFGNGFAPGASGLSLRGLGAASTLVLINGRRIAPYGLADDGQKVFADLNVIPLEAVERVEILKDGGSAVYGSDAIAGVVNVILRKNFKGTVASASVGQSRYGDGTETRATVTHGFGDLDQQGFNVLLNLEVSKKNEIWNRDRSGRGAVGRSDLRKEGYDAENTGGTNGGTGAIIAERGAAVSSVVGNVRNPSTLEYYSRSDTSGTAGFTRSFPGSCAAVAGNYPQGDPNGGCLTDASQQYAQVQPSAKTINFFGRFTKQLNADTEMYAELNLYKNKSDSSGTPSGVSGSTGYPGGPVSNAGVALGASHPDNPYFGTAARLRYLAADVGPRTSHVDGDFSRFVAGIKGTWASWDYDSAILFSENKVSNTRGGFLQRDVAFALLNPTAANVAAAMKNPAYAALPAGTFWRIGENAGLNSAALYAALSPEISNDASAKTTQIDLKVSREMGKLDGGPIGVAFGVEARRESISLAPTTGTDKGNIIGLGYSAYDGSRTVIAGFGEAVFPVTKRLELSAALRADHYSDTGTSVTPKLGAKWRPVDSLAVRGTFAKGFRAPSSAENGVGGLAAFTTAADPARCAATAGTIGCDPANVAIITSPNANLQPEKSTSTTLGMVWDLTPKTSATVDLWQIKRKNEINQETASSAIAANHVSRDASTALPGFPGDPGAITAVLTNYINSSESVVRGIDLDMKHRWDLGGGNGRVTLGLVWTHLLKLQRTDPDGTVSNFAGTHGNCDVTNCIGTPKDRINLTAAWDVGAWRVATTVNYRGKLDNKFTKEDTSCASTLADGTEVCKVGSFTTVDVTARFKLSDKTEIFGGIRNLFDRVPPIDQTTYGAVSYNPLDYSGAVGRYYSIGVRHVF